ncbi:MAG: CpaF family protein [Firmicutes bacterium]|nr:CpaF family protein [Bacillota bacterium]
MDNRREITTKIMEAATESIVMGDVAEDRDAMSIIEQEAFKYKNMLKVDDLIWVVDRVYGKLRGQLGPISYLLEDNEISEIMVNGYDRIFVERNGRIERVKDSFDSWEELEQVIRRIAASVRKEINEMSPILDARLKDGSRVNAILKNVALDGPSLTIRKFRHKKITLEEMVERGGLTEEAKETLRKFVISGYNIFVSGGTSTGKTTFLNALSDFIPEGERVVTIEDSAELKMEGIKNLVRLECRNANVLKQGAITMEMLIRTSLRMRPDRIVVGEVRGREVADMLQALNTGHSGMSTGHGNSIRGMLRRLEAMYISGRDMPLDAVRAQIVEGVDVMIQLARLEDGSRRVLEICEVNGFRDGEYVINNLYAVDSNLNLVKRHSPVNTRKMMLSGVLNEEL